MTASSSATAAPAKELVWTPEPDLTKLLPIKTVERALTAPGMPWELEQKLINGRLVPRYKNAIGTVRDVWRTAEKQFANRPYIGLNGSEWTFADVGLQVRLMVRWLRLHFNVRKGDRIGMIARNIPEFVVTFWATQELGAIFVPINAFGEGELLRFCIEDTRPRVVVVDVERWQRLKPFLPQLLEAQAGNKGFVTGLVVVNRKGDQVLTERPWITTGNKEQQDHTAGVFDWDAVNRLYDTPYYSQLYDALPPSPPIDTEDDATILYTSGTTSLPKGVLSTQSQFGAATITARYGSTRAFVRRQIVPPSPLEDATAAARTLLCVPLFHVTGLSSGLLGATQLGGRLELMSSWSLSGALERIERLRLKGMLGIGFMVREVFMHGTPRQLASIEAAGHGGALVSKRLPSEAQRARRGVFLSNGLGATETNGAFCTNSADEYHARPDSTGLIAYGVEAKIVDPATLTVVARPGEAGELWIRSPGVAKGYWNRPEATRDAFLQDGWYRTGDVCRMEADQQEPEYSWLYVVDRVKDLIIRGGENISCGMVEEAVYHHPAVQECAAVGFKEAKLGERVAVVLHVKKGSGKVTEAEIVSEAAKYLPKFARPEYIWIMHEALPHNANGKLEKNVLRKQVAERIAEQGGWKDLNPSKL